jgi:hypothetical protein
MEHTIKKKNKQEPKYVPEYKCKRCKKSNQMWVEQVYLKMDRLEKIVKFICEYLNIEEEVKKIE